MKPYSVSLVEKELTVRFSGRSVALPDEIQEKIDQYWDGLIRSGRPYRRGEVFTVTQKKVDSQSIELLVEKTDYAHYVYCLNVDRLGIHGVHIIHTACLVETSDNKLVFGQMGKHTSQPGTYMLCGGGIDNDDLFGDTFDFRHNITKELLEELDIDVHDASRVRSFDLAYLKEGGPTDKMTVIYRITLNETASEFSNKYKSFTERLQARNVLPEFDELVYLDKTRESIDSFLSQENILLDEYIRPLFEIIV